MDGQLNSDLAAEVAGLRARLAETEAMLAAVRNRDGKSLANSGPKGIQASGFIRHLQTEEVLRFLTQLLEEASQPFAITYPDEHIGLFNRAFQDLTGYTTEDLHRADCVKSLTPIEWRELERRELVQLHLTGQPVRYQKEIVRKDGCRVPIELLVHLARDAEGKPDYYYSFLTDITARKRAEAGMRDNERQFRTLADSIPNLAWWANGDGYITWYNRRWYEYTGTTPQQMEGWGWQNVHDLQTLPAVLERWRLCIATGEPFEMTFPLRGADGVFRSFLTRVVPLKDGQGRVQQWFGSNTDVSEQIKAEETVQRLNAELKNRVAQLQAANEEVRASRLAALSLMDEALQARKQAESASSELHSLAEQRRLALESADLGAWDYHFQSGDVTWDARCREMWGIPQADQVDYSAAIDRIHPDDRLGVDAGVKAALAGHNGGAYHREFRVVWSDGSVHWIASHGRVFFQGEGGQRRAVRFIGANREITVEKQAEEAIRQSEERYRRLVELSPEGVFVNRNDRIVLVNPAALELLGTSKAEELLGKSPFAIFHTDCHAIMRKRIGKLLAGERVPVLEEKLIRQDGVVVDVEVVAAPVMDQGQRAILVLLRDITERKRAQAVLQQSAEDLARSNRDLEQFAYVASHDLQEPLRAVGGYVKLLERRLPEELDAKAREYIAGAVDGAVRMEQLILDLLSYSRVGTHGGKFALADLNVALCQALRNLEVGIKSAQAIITYDPLPVISVDATQIMQLFQNLIANALKFHGEQPLKIHIGVQRQSDLWVFSVADNGIGIEPQYFKRIFQVFQRLHTRRKHPGTGIGLAICQKIVERHGGKIWVESQPDQGSNFYFSMPHVAGPGRSLIAAS